MGGKVEMELEPETGTHHTYPCEPNLLLFAY